MLIDPNSKGICIAIVRDKLRSYSSIVLISDKNMQQWKNF